MDIAREMESQAKASAGSALERLGREELRRARAVRAEREIQRAGDPPPDIDTVFSIIKKTPGAAGAASGGRMARARGVRRDSPKLDLQGDATREDGGEEGSGAYASSAQWIPQTSGREAEEKPGSIPSRPEGFSSERGASHSTSQQEPLAPHTLLISWRYTGAPPNVSRGDVSRALQALRGFRHSITDFRSFGHKCYVDLKSLPLTPAVLRDISSSLAESHRGGSGGGEGTGECPAVQFFAKEDVASEEDTCTVFVARLLGADEDDLLRLVREKTGRDPKSVRIARDKEGKSRNFGYVVMASREDARACATALMGQPLGLSSDIRTDLFVKDGEAKPTVAPRTHRILD